MLSPLLTAAPTRVGTNQDSTSFRSPRLHSVFLPRHPTWGETYDEATQQEIERETQLSSGLILDATNWRNHPDVCARTQVIFASWGMPKMNEDFLAAFPHLEAVFYAAGSVKNLVTDAFWDREIVLSNAAAANAVPVAEFTVAQIVLSAKQVWTAMRRMHAERCAPARAAPPGLYGSTVGLISLGNIGSLVAERLRDFAVEVIAYDPVCSAEQARNLGVTLVSLDCLFSRSSIISCHAPLLPQTTGLLQARHFSLMPTNATFINTARGKIVDQPGLIEVLRARPDLTAVLDVTDPEPSPPTSPLFDLPNVFLTPHLAGSMGNECYRMGRIMLEEFRRFQSGQPLLYRLNREAVERMA